MSSETILTVEGVSKKYCRTLRRAIGYGAADIARDFLSVTTHSDRLRRGEFWAVDDVTFSVQRGESLAIIGSNGSGKSTMLKMLNGILLPDRGSIELHGRTGALIEVGAGFHPLLTGRENILVNGMILGMTRDEVMDNFDRIVDFSELGDFVDTPVRNYSSGMYVRLGFAVAVHAPVEVLLVDEVLAVGDLAFRLKCMRRIMEFKDQGGTVVLVTHGMHDVKFICDRALWMESGCVRRCGRSVDVANEYEDYMVSKNREDGEQLSYDDQVRIIDLHVPETIEAGQPLVIDAELEFARPVKDPHFLVHLHAPNDHSLVFSHYSSEDGYRWDELRGRFNMRITTAPLSLRRGRYPLSFSVSEGGVNNHLIWFYRQRFVDVTNSREIFGHLDAAINYEVHESSAHAR